MRLSTFTLIAVIAAAFVTGPAFAEFEVREIDPLSEKDLSAFKIEGEGGWKLDDKTDLVHTFVVCPKTKVDTSIVFRARKFADGFQVKWEMQGGSRQKGLKFYIVPAKGDRIEVPLSSRFLMKKNWHKVTVTVEDGKAYAKINKEKLEKVDVPTDQELTFAITVPKRGEATLRKIAVKFLIINKDQAPADEGYVRIFDGKSLTGWKMLPENSSFFELKDQRIEGKLPRDIETRETHLVFAAAQFQDFTLKMRVGSGARSLLLLGRFGIQNGPKAVFADIAGYMPGDKDWNDVLWEVKGKLVTLHVNGRKVWTGTAGNTSPLPIHIILTRGGQCVLRDIQVKPIGNFQATPDWKKYADSSAGAQFGGRGNNQGGANAGSSGVSGGRALQMSNGKDLTDWGPNPSGVWKFSDGKMVGLTYGKTEPATLLYTKLWFQEYRLSFKLQKGSTNVGFVAKAFPRDKGKDPSIIQIDDSWYGEDKWTEFEAHLLDGTLKLKANGKTVKSLTVPKDAGVVGFVIAKESAVGIKEVWNNKKK